MTTAALRTNRLVIRPFVPADLGAVHVLLDRCFGDGTRTADPAALAERQSWIEWCALNQLWLPKLHQAPYGDLAVERAVDGAIVGVVGFVPLLDALGRIPELRDAGFAADFATPEFGLFWAIDPPCQALGYATEAARALVAHGFGTLRLRRLVATTTHANLASQRVMAKLGMRVCRNPTPEPPWLQIVGLLENPG